MTFKKYVVERLQDKNTKKKILFIDGEDRRAQKAALMHKVDGYIEPILLVDDAEHIPEDQQVTTWTMDDFKSREEELVAKYVERRKGKENEEQAKKAIQNKNFVAMLLLEMGEVDGVIGGLIAPTADILRPAFKIIGPKPGVNTIGSVMIMERAHEWYIFSDISVNIEPSMDQLVDIAVNASDFAKAIDFKTKVAFLSFSTSGSADHDRSRIVRTATVRFNDVYKPDYKAIGEVQFDAAFDPKVRETKYKDDGFKKNPTVFIFPSLEAGNIGYKIAQRMGGFGAIGPIITGVNKPVNDLSRGATSDDVYNTALITALQAKDE